MKNQTKKTKKIIVKILGQDVTVGTKEHAKLIYQKRLFEQNNGY